MKNPAACFLGILLFTSLPANAELIGHWTFEAGEETADKAGNFPDLVIQGDAEVVDGALDVNGSGTDATGWAITEGDYTGPTIESKTLVSWVTLEGLDDIASAGSVITIDSIAVDRFDGIIFAEQQTNRWMNGSNGFARTPNPDPGFDAVEAEETETGTIIQLAISYEDLGDGFMTITGYRNGVQIGQYDDEPASFWDSGDAEIIFGKRHFNNGNGAGPGGLDALIAEARIYDEVLTGEEIAALALTVLSDSDLDGLSDDWEIENFGNLDQLADSDPDQDGLENLDEQQLKTDPNDDDSDDDTLKDGVETKTGTFVDATNTGTDPLNDDSDGDTLKDNVETGTGTFVDATNTGTDPNNVDTDGDRKEDGAEVVAGTNPTDANDPPRDPIGDSLIGNWTFEPGEELTDTTGNFPDLELMGDAEIVDGKLDVNGGDNVSTGWAVTVGDYTGPTITSKTLVSWVTLQSLDDGARAGSAMTIDRVASDTFDGIIFAERAPNRWMNGSNGFSRSPAEQFDGDEAEETDAGQEVMMAITYDVIDDGFAVNITGYRNAVNIGEYELNGPGEWNEGDAEIFFGKRHGGAATPGPGGLDALIAKASLYDVALTEAQIKELFDLGSDELRPVGHWTFEPDEQLIDRAGNFPDLAIMGDAKVENGKLVVTGSGTDATGWAITDTEAGVYEGPDITNKTLMSWVSLDTLESGAKAGSAITIDRTSGDHFDGIIYAERQANRWMNGSSGFQRTQDWDPGFEETETDKLVHLASTYEHLDGGMLRVTGYRNGESIGTYDIANASNWDAEDAEIIFGKRHFNNGNGTGPGGLNATIEEARLYDIALDEVTIARIFNKGPIVAEDRDGDGLPDSWELVNFANLDQMPAGDPDNDGSNNGGELAAGTDPNDDDSDDDGLVDGVETNTGSFVSAENTGTDPLKADTDEDGLSDNVETGTGVFVDASNAGTDPNLADTDGDNHNDKSEIDGGTNPFNPLDPPPPPPGLIAQWSFEPGEELVDTVGNFPDLELMLDAVVEDGKLNIGSDGTATLGWAVTNSEEGEYTGPLIESKTLVSWAILESIDPPRQAGSLITIDRTSGDHFDGIIFAERQDNRWMSGSSGFQRTQDFDPGFEETELTDDLIKMAISYEHVDGGVDIKAYRNDELIGEYTSGNPSSWDTGDAEVFFGLRHGSFGGGGSGALDALIEESRIYDSALTRAQIEALPGPGASGEIFQIIDAEFDATARSLSVSWTSRVGATYVVESAEDVQLWNELTDGFPDGGATEETTTIVIEPIPDGVTQLYVRVSEE